MSQILTVLGTGTDIGKTYLTTQLLRYGRSQGITVHALKPVLTGWSDAGANSSDIGLIAQALHMPLIEPSYLALCGWRFPAPLGSDLAAKKSGISLSLPEVVAWCQTQCNRTGSPMTLIETAGGIMSPIDEMHTQVDLALAMGGEALLIGGNYLGGISHMLCAYELAKQRGVKLRAVVVNTIGTIQVEMGLCIHSLQHHIKEVPLYGLASEVEVIAEIWQATTQV